MTISIEISSDTKASMTNELPPDFTGPRLAGGEVQVIKGDFGALCIQEFDGGNFILRYSVLQTNRPVQMTSQSHYSGLHGLLMMKNRLQLVIEETTPVLIREGQFTMIYGEKPTMQASFPEKQQFICLETLVAPELIHSLLKDFPELSQALSALPSKPADVVVNLPKRVDEEVREHIHYIFTYSDPERWRRSYFENRVRDITWKQLATQIKADEELIDVTEEEEEKARLISNIVVEYLDEHVVIRELARKVASSESGIKKIFRKVFGMGIHEFRVKRRLKKAVELIESGMTVKEAAAELGWYPGELIKAFYKEYGTTPGTIRKKKGN